jgi:hypothetical protein
MRPHPSSARRACQSARYALRAATLQDATGKGKQPPAKGRDTPTFQAGHSWGGVLDSCLPFGAAGEVDGQGRPDREPVGASLVRSRDPLHTSPGVSVNLKDPSGDKGLLHNTRRSQLDAIIAASGLVSRARACPPRGDGCGRPRSNPL